jgi:G3E family GTPase
VKLGTKTKSLFGSKSGERFTAEMIGFLPEAGAYIVKDTRDNDMFIVPRRMILDKVIVDPKPVHRRNRFGFQFQLNSDVPFTIGLTAEGIHDSNGDLMDGQIVRAKVIYHIRDSGTKWYVLQVEAPHYDESDPDNWWSGFDIRREDCVK